MSGHVGQSTPMAEVEPYLVQLIIQLANMRTPISSAQGLKLANSLISGTKVEKKIEWKSNSCYAYKHASISGDENKKHGLGYWRSFLRRNKHLIRTKKQLNLTISALSGVLTITSKRCMMKSIKTCVMQVNHCGEMKMVKGWKSTKHMG
jgi:hypothetical protein